MHLLGSYLPAQYQNKAKNLKNALSFKGKYLIFFKI
ncbi:hypothetical protein AHMF7616_04424 [Adhaeribacter pallidiroseus]|uniref:Uncharacterized protein n=1 Tax=Adhaeribacter pallidiroseus TaxID=2072847 RepID=A0A369QM47_9BACT|nr:hypothetical protein AHMF7616_04424 [Adhaeribacter pallidiroseus]